MCLLLVVLLFCCASFVNSSEDTSLETEIKRIFDHLNVTDWFKIVRTSVEKSDDNQSKSGLGLIERFVQFLKSHELQITVPSSTTNRNSDEARTKKLKKVVIPLLIFLKLTAAVFVPVILAAIGMVAFNGFGMGLVALTIAVGVALKNFAVEPHHGSKVTYEIVPQVAPLWNRNGLEVIPSEGYHSVV